LQKVVAIVSYSGSNSSIQYLDCYKRFEVVLQFHRHGAATHQNTDFHILLHGVSSEVRAGNEANQFVAHRDFRVNFSPYIGFTFIAPRINSGSRKG
jgi:hypothetical protein